ncbi:MAG: prepilin peptidase [Bacilli bacterium]|nr:prepilin peptidase [Bacilli bacterium]
MAVLVFILGTILGSFYLVVGKRLPIKENAINSRSKCDNCNHVLGWWQLIPIFSYVILRGKCHYCHQRINPLHLLIEVVTGGLFSFAYLYYGVCYEMLIFLIVSSVTLIIFISDFSYYIILDSPLVVGSILVFATKWYYLGINDALISLISGLGLFASMYLIKIIGDVLFKRESLGGGDIKFAFVMGMILGYRLGLCSLILSTFLALPYSCAALMLKKNNEVPYGPFLASSLFVVFVFIEKFNSLLNLIFVSL